MKNLILCVLVVSLLSGCDKVAGLFGPAPKDVAMEYMQAILKGDAAKAYELQCAADRQGVSKDKYIKFHTPYGYLKVSRAATTIKPLSESLSGDKATVKVEVTSPDETPMLLFINEAGLADAEDPLVFAESVATAYLDKGNFPTKTETQEIALVKEADGWRVFTDEAQKQRLSEAKDLLSRAKLMVEGGSLDEAQKDLDEALAMLSDQEAIRFKTADVVTAIAHEKERLAREQAVRKAKAAAEKARLDYFKKVKVYDFESGRYDSYLDKNVPGVSFKLKNLGDRTLGKVQVTIYFKDKSDHTIYEKDLLPVLVSEYSFLGDNAPLKPGYIWQMEQGKFYALKKTPSEWVSGKASIKVTDIEFADK